MESSILELVVTKFHPEAKDTVVLELQHPQQQPLPPFTSGSHLEVHLANGLVRHYSLLNSPSESSRYVIAVGLATETRGGSQYIHHHIRVGDRLKVRQPRNNFPLVDTDEYCFIAGGIGITPILSMIHWCVENHKKWRLIYALRNKQRASFYEHLQAFGSENIHYHFNDENQHQHLNVEQIIASVSEKEHVYCCGPNSLMQSVQQASQHLEKQRIHFEWFSAPTPVLEQSEINTSDSFILKLKRSGKEIQVMADQSILDALEQEGFELPFSCRAGICRTCETTVCSGTPDHQDMILTDEERDSNQTMLICVSRAKSEIIELDL